MSQRKTIAWVKERKQKYEDKLVKIKVELTQLESLGLTSYTSLQTKEQLINLEKENIKLLRRAEETWCLNSRAIWLKSGDENTKFFQQYARGRRGINTIWALKDQHGREANTFAQLVDFGVRHFSNIYKSTSGANIVKILWVAEAVPRFVEEDEREVLNLPITLEELEVAIKILCKHKSPGADGWPIEFYITFLELIRQDLLLAIEDCRTSGRMSEAFNSTFITLIPKVDKPQSFDDFKPISLCNCIYNITSKIIALRIKPILSRMI